MSQPVIIKNKIVYGYMDKATVCRDMGREDYNDLTEAQQLNGDVCFIQGVDASAFAPTNSLWNKVGTTPLANGLPADCSNAINQLKSNLTVNILYNSNNIILKQMGGLYILTFDGVSASDLTTAQSTLLSYMPTDQVIRNTLFTSISGVLYFAVCLFRASDSTVSVSVVGTYGNTAANFFNTQHLLYGSLVWFK